MTRLLLALLIAAGCLLAFHAPVSAGCETASSFTQTGTECRKTPQDVRDAFASAADDGVTYTLESRC